MLLSPVNATNRELGELEVNVEDDGKNKLLLATPVRILVPVRVTVKLVAGGDDNVKIPILATPVPS